MHDPCLALLIPQYGLSSVSSNRAILARDSTRPRSLSNSSHLSAGRTHARCASPANSVVAQVLEGTAKERTSASHATSLPPPKGFLSPKSPLRQPKPPSQREAESPSPSQTKTSSEDFSLLEGITASRSHPSSALEFTHHSPNRKSLEATGGGRTARELSSDHLLSQGPIWPSPMSSLTKSSRTDHALSEPCVDRSSVSTWEVEKEGGHTPLNRSIKQQRNYQTLPASGITFLLHGRFVTGGDSPLPCIASALLILGVGGCWLGTTGVWLWQESRKYGLGSGGVAVVIVFVYVPRCARLTSRYLLLSTLSSMAGASLRDPGECAIMTELSFQGILPRNLDLSPPLSHISSTDTLIPLPRELRVRDER